MPPVSPDGQVMISDIGAHLLEILRNPDAVQAVEAAAAGDDPKTVVIENPRGLWEVHAFPVRGGGAVVLMTDVGLVRRAAEFDAAREAAEADQVEGPESDAEPGDG